MTIVVTGGGRGIGRAIAVAFAEPGRTVAVAARTRAQLDETAKAIRDRGASPVVIAVDVADEEAVAAAFRELRDATDRVDVLVNNAGVGGGAPIHKTDAASWRRIIDTNVWGTFLVTRQAIPLMGEGGRIVNMSSVLGRFGVPGYTAYCASKHAVIGFTRALALELADRRITVNAICPGWVDTEMAAQGMRMGAAAAGGSFEAFRANALGDWREVMNRSADIHDALIAEGLGEVAPYAVAMAYRVRFYMDMNAREAMHVIELRTAPQGHPAYRRVCQLMHRAIAEVAGHRAIAGAMQFADHSEVELERLQSERAMERKRFNS